jgi:hypothetical protein
MDSLIIHNHHRILLELSSNGIRWLEHVAGMGLMGKGNRTFVGILRGREYLRGSA